MENEEASKVLESFPGSTFKYMHRPPPTANCPDCAELGCGRCRLCDVCWTKVTGPVYHSSDNDVDVHPECAKLQPWIRLGNSVFGMRKESSATNCDRCKKKAFDGHILRVKEFSYVSTCGKHSYHVNCLLDMKNEVMTSKVLNSFPDSTFKYMHRPPPGANCADCVELGYYCGRSRVCDVCWTIVKGPVYHSSKNDVDVHPDCAKLQPWIRLGDSLFGMRKDSSATKCDWCKRKALDGHTQRLQGFSYVSTCGKHSYHVNCLMDMKNEVMASKVLNSFPNSTFKYMHRPPPGANCSNCVELGYYCGRSRVCDVCWTMVTGPVYHSSNNDVDVHPECSKLQPWIRLGDSVFGMRKESSATHCDWCKRKALDGHIQCGQGFCYVSTCGKHSYHVNCLMDMNSASSSMPAVQKQALHSSGGDRIRLIRIMVTVPFMFIKIALSFISGDPTTIFFTLGVQLYKMWRMTKKIKSH